MQWQRWSGSTANPLPTLSLSGTLPEGLTFADAGNGIGTLSGTPVSGSVGTYALTLTATNGVGTAAVQQLTLTVGQAASTTAAVTTSG